ncbi:response regulator [Halobacteriovorax sp. GFR7]|uniref:response regulator n=1 Tax=unclassified Halobacteriovorax TaxID=2639665 RepID=UPI00372262E1
MPYKVLIVDDEPDILELLAEELQFEGYETECANSGNSAVKLINSGQTFDAIISDYKMPDGNGKVVLDCTNSNDSQKEKVFYFVSGQADISLKEAMKEGVTRFFYKPFDLDELLTSLKKDLQ